VNGPAANRYFDFRTISSAEVVQIGDRTYMLYEGIRGPGPGDAGDSQFGLGLARSQTDRIDGPWEKYPGNPLLVDLPGNIGLGHADLVVVEGQTILYTALVRDRRSRLALVWKTGPAR
jgi:beta-xylosidase